MVSWYWTEKHVVIVTSVVCTAVHARVTWLTNCTIRILTNTTYFVVVCWGRACALLKLLYAAVCMLAAEVFVILQMSGGCHCFCIFGKSYECLAVWLHDQSHLYAYTTDTDPHTISTISRGQLLRVFAPIVCFTARRFYLYWLVEYEPIPWHILKIKWRSQRLQIHLYDCMSSSARGPKQERHTLYAVHNSM